MRTLIASISAVILTACASTPGTYTFENSRTVDASFDKTWEAVIGYFAENNIGIETLEKDSGIIVAENTRYRIGVTPYVADCGVKLAKENIGTARVNIFAKPVSDDKTDVQVNTAFSFMTRDWTTTGALRPSNCTSTGELEKSLLDRIEADAR